MTRGSSRILKSAPRPRSLLEARLQLGRVGDHRPELEHRELPLADADPAVDVEDRAARAELDRERDQQPERQEEHRTSDADGDVEGALDRPVPTGEDGRTQLEERRAWPGTYSPRCTRSSVVSGARRTRIPCLCACSTIFKTARSSSAASERITSSGRTSSSTLAARHAIRAGAGRDAVLGDGADELVGQPAASGGERVPESARTRPPPRGRRAAGSRRAHQLERDRLVGGAEQPDRQRGDDDGRRDQPGGAEVVVGPMPNASTISATTISEARIRPAPGRRSRGGRARPARRRAR